MYTKYLNVIDYVTPIIKHYFTITLILTLILFIDLEEKVNIAILYIQLILIGWCYFKVKEEVNKEKFSQDTLWTYIVNYYFAEIGLSLAFSTLFWYSLFYSYPIIFYFNCIQFLKLFLVHYCIMIILLYTYKDIIMGLGFIWCITWLAVSLRNMSLFISTDSALVLFYVVLFCGYLACFLLFCLMTRFLFLLYKESVM